MSSSSFSDVEKDVGFEKSRDSNEVQLTQQQEDLIEASEPPFPVESAQNGTVPLEKTTTTASAKPSIHNIKHVPNGGLKAWLQVLGSFFLFWNTWGAINLERPQHWGE